MCLTFRIVDSKVLGKGAFAKVFEGKWNCINVAVKRIRLDDLLTVREEETMKQLDHPNVLKLLAVEEDKNFKYLILELGLATVGDYCKGKYQEKMPTDPVALYQMADGLSYIHGQHLVHRDISTGNVLVVLNGDEVIMKIADFGFCKPASKNGSFSISQRAVGTQHFFAPEILRLVDDEIANLRGNVTCDVFSLGCLFFVFLTKNKHPFSDGRTLMIPGNVINNKQYLGGLEAKHDYAKPLIEGMIRPEPENRLALNDIKISLMLHMSQSGNSGVA